MKIVAVLAVLAGTLASSRPMAADPPDGTRLVVELVDEPTLDRIEVERVFPGPAVGSARGEASAFFSDGSLLPLAFRRSPVGPDGTVRWRFRGESLSRRFPPHDEPPRTRFTATVVAAPGDAVPRTFRLRCDEGGRSVRVRSPSAARLRVRPFAGDWAVTFLGRSRSAYASTTATMWPRDSWGASDSFLLFQASCLPGSPSEVRGPFDRVSLGGGFRERLVCIGTDGGFRWSRGVLGAELQGAARFADGSCVAALVGGRHVAVERGDGGWIDVRRETGTAGAILLLVRFDAAGTVQWHRVVTAPDYTGVLAVLPRSGGASLLLFRSYAPPTLEDAAGQAEATLPGTTYQALALDFGAGGDLRRDRILGDSRCWPWATASFPDGSFAISGQFHERLDLAALGGPAGEVRTAGGWNGFIARYDAEGDYLWAATAEGPAGAGINASLVALPDSSLVAAVHGYAAGEYVLRGPSGEARTVPFDAGSAIDDAHGVLLTAWGADGAPGWTSYVRSRSGRALRLAALDGRRFLVGGKAWGSVVFDEGGPTESALPGEDGTWGRFFLAAFEAGTGFLGIREPIAEASLRATGLPPAYWTAFLLGVAGQRAVIGCEFQHAVALWPGEPEETRFAARGRNSALVFTAPCPGTAAAAR